MKRWALLAVVVIAALAAAELLSGSPGGKARAAPPLPTTPLERRAVSLASLHGEPTLVAFWASWCGPCHEDAPALRAAAGELGRRAHVVAVDWDDSTAAARAFVRRFRWSFPVLADATGKTGERYGVAGLPTTFVLDPERRDRADPARSPVGRSLRACSPGDSRQSVAAALASRSWDPNPPRRARLLAAERPGPPRPRPGAHRSLLLPRSL